jgi:hypothetical protein
VIVTGWLVHAGDGETVNVDVGFGMTVTGTVIGAPVHPLFVGVMVYVTVALGQTELVSALLIGEPVPELPSDATHAYVVPVRFEERLMFGEEPEQIE